MEMEMGKRKKGAVESEIVCIMVQFKRPVSPIVLWDLV